MVPQLSSYVKAFTVFKREEKNQDSNTWADVAAADHTPSGGHGRCYWSPNQIRVLATIQLAMGLLCIVFQIIGIVLHSAITSSGHGFWAGILFIAAGCAGFISSKQKTQLSILICLVVCILDVAASVCVIILSCGSLFYDRKVYSTTSLDIYHYSSKGSRVATDAILITLASLELIATIWCIILCARLIFASYRRGGIFMPYQVQYIASDLQPATNHNPRIFSQAAVYPVSSIVPLLCEEDEHRMQTNQENPPQ